jgi:hypothetical protein
MIRNGSMRIADPGNECLLMVRTFCTYNNKDFIVFTGWKNISTEQERVSSSLFGLRTGFTTGPGRTFYSFRSASMLLPIVLFSLGTIDQHELRLMV